MLQGFFRIIRRTSAKGSKYFIMCIRLTVRVEQLCSKCEDLREMFEDFY